MLFLAHNLSAAVLQGRLAAEAEAHARNLADLERHLREVCSQAGITPADGEAPPGRLPPCCFVNAAHAIAL